jgi:glycosyltransferase involved in cell wall biosynthesis
MEVRRSGAINILLINYEYPPVGGGAGNATMFIARALNELGHRATVLTSAFAALTGSHQDAGVKVLRLNVRRKAADRSTPGEMLSFVFAALRAAPGLAASEAIDAVIVFFTLPCGPVALRLHRTMQIPYVVSLRGGDVPGQVPGIAWQHRLLTFVRRRVLRFARAIVANDDGLARLSRIADPFPVLVIPNGVDCRFFVPRVEPKDEGRPVTVLFVGRFHREKNLPFFLEQLARLRAACPDGWRLSLVGDGVERTAIEECARHLGLADITTWHGWQSDKRRLLELYQEADVVVNPSLYEGMPNVVLEAMACGLPVVATAIPGNDSLVQPGKTGFLFKLGDGDALCAALREIRDKPVLAHTLGRNGRRRVEDNFTWMQAARGYLRLFQPPVQPVSPGSRL